ARPGRPRPRPRRRARSPSPARKSAARRPARWWRSRLAPSALRRAAPPGPAARGAGGRGPPRGGGGGGGGRAPARAGGGAAGAGRAVAGDDLGHLELGVVLAVAGLAAVADLRLVLEDDQLLALGVGVDDLGDDAGAGDGRRSDRAAVVAADREDAVQLDARPG